MLTACRPFLTADFSCHCLPIVHAGTLSLMLLAIPVAVEGQNVCREKGLLTF